MPKGKPAGAQDKTVKPADSSPLGTFGDVDDEELDYLDDPPVPFQLVGIHKKKNEDGTRDRELFEFHIQPSLNFGRFFGLLQQTNSEGRTPVHVGAQFVGDALIEGERENWLETLRRPDLEFRAEAIQELTQALGERYGVIPTTPRSDSSTRPRHNGRTTTAAPSSKASASKKPASKTA